MRESLIRKPPDKSCDVADTHRATRWATRTTTKVVERANLLTSFAAR